MKSCFLLRINRNLRAHRDSTLMFFSHTQHGTQYTPHLTRFYASLAPPLLMPLIQEFLEKSKNPFLLQPTNVVLRSINSESEGRMLEKKKFKGWVEVEKFTWNGVQGSFCLMKKDEGNPISWKQPWRFLVQPDLIDPHVLRK